MGSCLSTQPGDAPAWPHWWRKRHSYGGEREGAAAAGGVFFSSSVGGRKLPGEGDMMTEEELARVAGRTCANGASAAACLHTQQGRKGTNQDAMVVWEVSCRHTAVFSFVPVDLESLIGGGARSTGDSLFKPRPF
jgi:hypothetical protein